MKPSPQIPLSVIIVTRNEERNLGRCLAALSRFDEVIVVDSQSSDGTRAVAGSFGVPVVPFSWDGCYPKKRQWCLERLGLRHDRIFFVDADEEVTEALCREIGSLDWQAAGYFVKSSYVIGGKTLKHGLKNNKLCLFDRTKMEFPVVDDLNAPGMGEIEGHYQPVLKTQSVACKIRQLKNTIRHHAFEDFDRWQDRHQGYAAWEKTLRANRVEFREDGALRSLLKRCFRRMPLRPWGAFVHSYILKGGFLDGREGLFLARSRFYYYRLQ